MSAAIASASPAAAASRSGRSGRARLLKRGKSILDPARAVGRHGRLIDRNDLGRRAGIAELGGQVSADIDHRIHPVRGGDHLLRRGGSEISEEALRELLL